MKKYALEIYAPGNRGDDAVCIIESDEPFSPFQKGDLINPRTWQPHSHECAQAPREKAPHGTLLRVTGIEHFLVQKDSGFSQHKIGVFTEPIDDIGESRPAPAGALSVTERWILSNQYRILEKLYPDEADALSEARQAIENGYELHYPNFRQHIEVDVFTAGECKDVLDILSMFEAIRQTHERLEDKSGIDDWRVTFSGFDGNNETRQMAYARYFCEHDGGRFKTLNVKYFNSHSPRLGHYRAMVKEWKKSANEHVLTKDDLIRIAAAKAERPVLS